MIWTDIPRRHKNMSWPSFLSFKLLKILYFFYLVSTPCQTALIGNLLSNFCNETWKVIVICDEIWSTDNLTIWSTENCCQALVPSPVPLDPNPNPSPIGVGVTLKTHVPTSAPNHPLLRVWVGVNEDVCLKNLRVLGRCPICPMSLIEVLLM